MVWKRPLGDLKSGIPAPTEIPAPNRRRHSHESVKTRSLRLEEREEKREVHTTNDGDPLCFQQRLHDLCEVRRGV